MPSTPAMTTGMMFFITASAFITPMLLMPTPLLAVPYAAPRSVDSSGRGSHSSRQHDISPLQQREGVADDMRGKDEGKRDEVEAGDASNSRTVQDSRVGEVTAQLLLLRLSVSVCFVCLTGKDECGCDSHEAKERS